MGIFILFYVLVSFLFYIVIKIFVKVLMRNGSMGIKNFKLGYIYRVFYKVLRNY